TVPVSLPSATLSLKVVSIAPLGVSMLAFHEPLGSAANTVKAKTAIRANSDFIVRSFMLCDGGSRRKLVTGPTLTHSRQYENFLTLIALQDAQLDTGLPRSSI